jgi:hypothetical protein
MRARCGKVDFVVDFVLLAGPIGRPDAGAHRLGSRPGEQVDDDLARLRVEPQQIFLDLRWNGAEVGLLAAVSIK